MAKGFLFIFGCGYIGAALLARQREAGWRVGALTRNAEKAAQLREAGADPVIVADLAEGGWREELPHGITHVVNAVSSAGGGMDGYRHSYLGGNRRLAAWLERYEGVQRVVYTSSTAVYADADGALIDENAPKADSERARILLEAEALVHEAMAPHVPLAVTLRLAGLYGPGRHLFLDRLRAGDTVLPGRGEVHLNLLHRDDAASALAATLTAPQDNGARVWHVADNEPSQRQAIANWLADELGLAPPRFDPNAVSPRGRAAGMADRRLDNRAFRTAMGWEPTYPSFREGYRAILAGDTAKA